ncbi:MAG: S9 family peptidase [Calditrichaceae bacterium]|nr:S9 family peptidase [Calditrichia bacterium]NUQ44145.1 S9 family peptidase [Calditrichaceae bacterium]
MLFGGVFLLVSCQSEPTLIPRETLFGNPTNVVPQISPDGNMLAYLAPSNGVLNVWVRTIGQQNDRVVTNDTLRGIRRYFWAADNKHVMYLQDVGGDENWRLYGVNLETAEIKDLTPYEKVQVQIVDRNKHFPNELLIAMNKENPQLFDVYHLNLESGELTLVANNPGNVIAWLTDADFNVRCAMASTPAGGFELWVRPNEKSAWSTVLTWDSNDALTSGPVSFTKDGKSLYLQDSRNVNAGRLVKLELESGNIEVIAQDPQYDVANALIHPDEYTIQAVSFYRAREEWTVLDPSIQADFDAIAKLDKGDFNIIDRDNADNTWVVSFMKDAGPISYYAFDRKLKKGAFLFDHRPELKQYELTPMEPVSFTSRDGLTIHGYITFPKGQSKKNLPLVLNVHGGPWARDRWGFDSEAQWLANRGYACLQVNFRGSTGYGKEFLNAGDKEWGGKMHNDLVDAVKWAVQQGYADSNRVAIYGGSYGGYAALVGATFTPDLFRCAVDIVGPSNLTTWITSIPPYWATFRDLLYRRVGHPETEAEFLKSRSPLFKADQIKIPMLIAQGANDPRVPQAESEQIVAALKEKGIDHQYLLFPDEGHGFARPENRLKFYAAAEEFLAKHLGGRFEGEAAK